MEEKIKIILVGRTRSGKSTAIKVLTDVKHVANAGTIFFRTKQPENTTLICPKKMILDICDTPGLFEISEKNEPRNNDTLLDLIKPQAQIADFIFVTISFDAGFNDQDIESLMIFMKLFGKENVKILLTRSENSDSGERTNWINSLNLHPIIKYCGLKFELDKNIFFLGSNTLDYDQKNSQQIDFINANIKKMRNSLLKFFYSYIETKK